MLSVFEGGPTQEQLGFDILRVQSPCRTSVCEGRLRVRQGAHLDSNHGFQGCDMVRMTREGLLQEVPRALGATFVQVELRKSDECRGIVGFGIEYARQLGPDLFPACRDGVQ